jgi:hypothetical protein
MNPCFACKSDAMPPPTDNRGHFVSHLLAMVTIIGQDLLIASLCPLHADLYNACVEGAEIGMRTAVDDHKPTERPS